MARKKISQREAHRMRKRLAFFERMHNLCAGTPNPRHMIASVELTDAQVLAMRAGQAMGGVLRWEQFPERSFKLFVYKVPNV